MVSTEARLFVFTELAPKLCSEINRTRELTAVNWFFSGYNSNKLVFKLSSNFKQKSLKAQLNYKFNQKSSKLTKLRGY